MEIPEGVIHHTVCSSLPDDDLDLPCDCGSEQRARRDGAVWAEHFAEIGEFSYNAQVHLQWLAEQLRAGEL